MAESSDQMSLPVEQARALSAVHHGSLLQLLAILSTEARAVRSRWAFRQLPRGALVAVKLRDDGRRIVRIAREAKPPTKDAWQRWELELSTFVKHLGLEGWQREVSPGPETGVASLYVELWEGEVAPDRATCAECGADVPFEPVWGKAQRRTRCAISAGRQRP